MKPDVSTGNQLSKFAPRCSFAIEFNKPDNKTMISQNVTSVTEEADTYTMESVNTVMLQGRAYYVNLLGRDIF